MPAVDPRPTPPSKLPCRCGCSHNSATVSTDAGQLVGIVAATSADAPCACRMWRASLEHVPPWTSPPCRIVARGSLQGKEKYCCDGGARLSHAGQASRTEQLMHSLCSSSPTKLRPPAKDVEEEELNAQLGLEPLGVVRIADRCAGARRMLSCTTVGDLRDPSALDP